MSQFVVTVDNDVYTGEYRGESLEISELNGNISVLVNEEDGSFTAHTMESIESIEIE